MMTEYYMNFEYIQFDGFMLNGNHICPSEVVKLVNELIDTNNHLKKEIESLEEDNDRWEALSELDGVSIDEVKKENMELKEKNEFLEFQLEVIDAMTKAVNSMIR